MHGQYTFGRWLTQWVVVGVLVLWAVQALAFPTNFVSAQEEGEEPNLAIVWYAETFDVTYAEAERRLLLANEMSTLGSLIIDNEPTYGGLWVEHTPEFGMVVAFASPDAESLIQPYLEGLEWADLVRVQQAPYAYDELMAISEQVQQAAFKTGIPFASGTNVQLAKTTFYTPYPAELQSLLEADLSIEPYWDEIEYIYQATLSVPAVEESAALPFAIYLPIAPYPAR